MATKKQQSKLPTGYLEIALEVSGHNGARGNTYGSAKENFERIADLMTAQLGVSTGINSTGILLRPLTANDVGQMMILVKMSRLANSPNHADSLVDIAGYVNCLDTIHQFEAEEGE